ncbi:MAG: hypothetical protein JW850_11235, partial [Thermoflexales bacterium]|nr:hypothetical protein [Thermoflexales bacterium]
MSFLNGPFLNGPAYKAHPFFRFVLIACLGLGLAVYLAPAERIARADTPPPPAEEESAQLDRLAREAANRAQALALPGSSDEGEDQLSIVNDQFSNLRAPAAELTVGQGCTYTTIAEAIAAAYPGDTLLIEGGRTFTENLTIPISLTLRGGYNGCASLSAARTTIDGGGIDRVIVVNPGLAVTLENLNVTNGSTPALDGGGIRFAAGGSSGTLNLNHVDIYNNTAYWGGGLWVGPNAEVIGTDVEVYSNTAVNTGGGLRLYGGRATFSGGSNIRDNTARTGAGVSGVLQDGYAPTLNLPDSTDIYDNQALSGAGLGGGIYLEQGSVTLAESSDLYSNSAIQGGGAYLVSSTLTIQGEYSEIMLNTATGDGGGVYAQGSTLNLDDQAELYANRAGTGGTGYGGGAYLDDSTLWGDKATIHYNQAADGGGGVYATNSSLLDMDLGGFPCTGPRCSRLSNNTATNEWGGGVEAYNSEVDLRQTFVENNTATYGGGVYARDSSVYLYNVLLAGNSGGAADGIRLYNANLFGSEDSLAYNPADGTGTLVAAYGTSSLSLARSIVWGHASGLPAGQTVTCSDVQGGYVGGVDILNLDPLFADPAGADFHLQSLSPAIDRCTGGLSVDFDNAPRPLTHVRPTTPYDMGADEAAPRVGLNGAGCAYGRIQDAVDAASSGDTIQAASDTFLETVDISTKNLTIAGGYDVDCTTYVTGTSTVDGSDSSADSVFDITNSTVTLRDLDITGGDSGTGGGVNVLPGSARVTLDNTDVFGNQASYGGGLYVDVGNVLTITRDSDVTNNTATAYGGGARVWGTLLGDDWSSSITNNSAPNGGGVAVPGGVLHFDGSHVTDNIATGAQGRGGGIYVYAGGVVTLTGSSNISRNDAYDGAGIYADAASLELGAVLHSNVATNYGGGVYLANDSTLRATGTYVGYSAAGWGGNEAARGGGIYAVTSTVDFAGNIYNNLASVRGAGIHAEISTITLTNASVGGTGANQANRLASSSSYGVGLYLDNRTHAMLSNTVVASNTFPATATMSYGGGAFVTGGSVMTLTNSTVERHLAPSTIDGRGGGIYLSNATLTLENSQVLSNTAGTLGGGVRLYGDSTLNVLDGSEVSFNHAFNGEGGGIAAAAIGTPDINITDATLQNNTANTDGGAIYLSAGTLDFSGWWNVRGNSAGGNGGAVAVTGSGDVDFVAGSTPANLVDNDAGGNGGALYVDNDDTVELYATTPRLFVTVNTAAGNGGAAYAGNGGGFDVRGRLRANANSALGNGGAFYLGDSSQLSLDVYGSDVPRFELNYADNGGAVYAADGSTVRCNGAEFGRPDAAGNLALAGGSGGALYLSGSVLTSTNCLFRNNQAPYHGGAIAAYTSTLAIDADYATCDPATVQCSAIYSNTADSDGDDSGSGGGMYLSDSELFVDHTYLYRNSAARGGAVFQTGSSASAQVRNSLIYSNVVSVALGAGIRAQGGTFSMTHTTIANNVGGAGYSQSGTASAVHNSIAWGNGAGGFLGTYVITTCNVDQNGNAGINVDPDFVSPGAGEDYHLLGSSPAINACDTGLSPDLDNVPRPVAGRYDAGAFEYAYGLEFAPDRAGAGLPGLDVVYTHTITNTGGTTDSFSLAASSSLGWGVSVVPTPSVALDGGQSAPVTVTLSVPAGTLSDTVDVVAVTATSGADPNLVAAVVDTTTVGFAPSGAFAPDNIRTGAEPGQTYYHMHALTNTGNAQDTFNLVLDSSAGWSTFFGGSGPFILAPNASTPVVVQVDVPSGGAGLVDTTVVTATSAGGAAPVTVRDTTSAFVPGVAFVPLEGYTQTVPVETVVTVTHQLTNTGNATDTFHLAWSTSRGWGEVLDTGPFTLTQNATQAVRVRVQTPPASGGLSDTTVVTVTSAGGAGPAVVRDTTSTFAPGLALAPDYTDTVDAGASLTYIHRLTNTGEYTDTFDLLLSDGLGWAVLLDLGPLTLAAGEAAALRVRVDVPLDAGGLTNTLELEASSRAGSISAAATGTLIVVRTYGVALVPDHAGSINPGEALTCTHWLTNTGNGADTFGLTLSSSRGWATLLDPGPIDLQAGTGITVRVRVDVPLDSGGLTEISSLQATSQLSPTVRSFATDTTTSIYIPGLSLTPDYSQGVAPGAVLTYTHWLTNTGNGAEQFSLNLNSSRGWASLLDLEPYSLGAGEGISLLVRVSVPAGSGGLVDTTLITATAQSGGSATATDVTTATHVPGVQLIPDRAASILPGQAHIYTHTLSNTGNGPDTIGLTLTSSLGWASLLDSGPFSLGTGGSTELRVRVQVPAGVISGSLTEMTIITATSYADPARGDLSIDTSTVGFAPGVAFGPDHVNTSATPGEAYTYTHGLTNTGNHTDSFELAFASSAAWGELLDTGPFTLGPGLSTTVRVSVSMPASGGVQFDTSVVTATSQGGAGPVTVHDVTSAFSPGVDLAPDYAQVVAVGSAITYTHRLTNTGTSTDTLRLNLSSSLGWANLLDGGPFTLASGDSISVRVRVDAPAGSGGLTDVTVVTASALDGSGPEAAVTDTTNAVYAASVALAPNYAASALPGSSIVYTHRLTNTGNGLDVFSLDLHSRAGWGSLLDPGPFSLSAGEGTDVRVELSLPPGSGGLVETVFVTATSETDPGARASVAGTVTAVYSVTASRTDILAAGVYTFGDTCAQLSFAGDADRGGLTAVTVTLVYAYPTGQLAARPLPRHYTIEGDRSSGFSATLSLCYLDAEWTLVGIGDENALQLYRYAGVPTWEPYSSTVDTVGNTVTAT